MSTYCYPCKTNSRITHSGHKNMMVKIRVKLPLAKERLGPQKREMMIVVVQSLSHVWLFETAACQLSLSFTISQSLLKLVSIESEMSSNHLVLCCPLFLLPSIFPTSGSFLMSQLFASRGQNIGVSASAAVLPVNIPGWSPLGWTGWISLQSKGFSWVFCNTTVQKHQCFDLFLLSNSPSIHDYWKWCYCLISLRSISPLTSLEGQGKGGARGNHSSAGRRRRTKRRKKEKKIGIYFKRRKQRSQIFILSHCLVTESSFLTLATESRWKELSLFIKSTVLKHRCWTDCICTFPSQYCFTGMNRKEQSLQMNRCTWNLPV